MSLMILLVMSSNRTSIAIMAITSALQALL